jgi:hypothetical protein
MRVSGVALVGTVCPGIPTVPANKTRGEIGEENGQPLTGGSERHGADLTLVGQIGLVGPTR